VHLREEVLNGNLSGLNMAPKILRMNSVGVGPYNLQMIKE
jgi:hypothetical protein